MDPSELDRSLTELDEKIDRLRSLYEQYFMGLEKLEPQVPRKDVDRRIVVLRKEHIRNTALKFRFQTLIQRYNTMQQHWSRTLREIENGTYRRDLMKAAARFGVEEALTAVGRKRASKLLGALEKQRERETHRKRMLGDEPADDLVVDVDMGEYDADAEDDAPTPPPVRREAPRVHVLDESDAGAWDASDEDGVDAPAPPLAAKRNGLAQLFPKSIPAKKAEPSPSVPPQQRGGLRLGGGPSRRASPEALARLASLAGMDEPFDDAGASVPAPPKPGRKPLLSSPLGFDIGSEPPPPPEPERPQPVEAKPAASKADAAAQKREKPRLAPPPNAAPQARAEPAAIKPEPIRPEPMPKSEPKAKRFGDLSDQRLREIYSEYVHVRRQRNESTAGITFDKLADSLRTQAERLGEKHGRKRVDYEVIVKDGKTLIKPIVK